MNPENLLINNTLSIKEAMRMIDFSGMGIGFVVDSDKKFLGTVADSDIRRAILKGINIEKPVSEIACQDPIFINESTKEEDVLNLKKRLDVKEKMPSGGRLIIPVLEKTKKVKDVVLFYDEKETPKKFNKILVIGGAGYLGSVLCRKILEAGYKLKVLDNLSYGEKGIQKLNENPNFEFLKGDIRNITEIVEGIKNVDAVIHLAAIVGDPACAKNPEETLETNYLATKNIVEACKYFQVNRFVFASTCSVYGKNSFPGQKLKEDSLLNPISLYAETKIKCEKAILEAMDENFSPVILRMATLYGYSPNMRFDLSVNLMAAKALFEKKISIFGGEQWRPWLHLEDAASAYISCLEKPLNSIRGQTFNVLSENYKITEVGKLINSVFPEANLEISDKAVDMRDYNVSFDKIRSFLNFSPKKRIADGAFEIKKAIDDGIIKDYKNSEYRVTVS